MASLGAVYGVLAFVAGFVFGALREMLLIPLLGETAGRWAEFVPLVVVIIFLGWQVAKRSGISRPLQALALGATGVVVLLVLESGFALIVLGMPLKDYLAGFDVTSGELFPFGLLIMLLTPWAAVMTGRSK